MARSPLTRAIGGSDPEKRLAKGDLARWLPTSVAEAERKIVDGWMKQFGKAQELPRQRVTQFSQWFNSFEPPVAGSAGSSREEAPESDVSDGRGGSGAVRRAEGPAGRRHARADRRLRARG